MVHIYQQKNHQTLYYNINGLLYIFFKNLLDEILKELSVVWENDLIKKLINIARST